MSGAAGEIHLSSEALEAINAGQGSVYEGWVYEGPELEAEGLVTQAWQAATQS